MTFEGSHLWRGLAVSLGLSGFLLCCRKLGRKRSLALFPKLEIWLGLAGCALSTSRRTNDSMLLPPQALTMMPMGTFRVL